CERWQLPPRLALPCSRPPTSVFTMPPPQENTPCRPRGILSDTPLRRSSPRLLREPRLFRPQRLLQRQAGPESRRTRRLPSLSESIDAVLLVRGAGAPSR